MPISVINQEFTAQMTEFKNFTANAFAEIHRLIAECDRMELVILDLLKK